MDWNSRRITGIIENALLEDRATRDATSYACIDANQRAAATVIARQDCILAGIGCIARILDVYAALDGAVTAHYEVTTHPEIFDGVRLRAGQSVAVIRLNARVILSCERVILNFLQRMSGIATLTRKFVDAVSGTRARILDTRKTAPGLRVVDKNAVRCGGGQNHRLDLGDLPVGVCGGRLRTRRAGGHPHFGHPVAHSSGDATGRNRGAAKGGGVCSSREIDLPNHYAGRHPQRAATEGASLS
jgi:hypothetical protein